jgi:hypothetical protein
VAPVGNCRQRTIANDERERIIDEVIRLRARSKPLEGEPWTWQWGETNPRGRWRSKTVEGVRNAEDGARWPRKPTAIRRRLMSR